MIKPLYKDFSYKKVWNDLIWLKNMKDPPTLKWPPEQAFRRPREEKPEKPSSDSANLNCCATKMI